MKFGAVILCANEWRFMPAVLGQLSQVVDRLVVLRNRLSLSGLRVALEEVPALAVETVEGEWESEAAARNAGMELLSDYDYVFIVDSDELLTLDALNLLKSVCEQRSPRAIGARFYTYWKTPEYIITPPETKPLEASAPIIVRKEVRFTKHRIIDNGEVMIPPVFMVHHLSYVRTDEEMRDKLLLFGHADEVVPNWFENVWKKWDEDPTLENLHPTRPEAFQRAVQTPSRTARELLARWGCK